MLKFLEKKAERYEIYMDNESRDEEVESLIFDKISTLQEKNPSVKLVELVYIIREYEQENNKKIINSVLKGLNKCNFPVKIYLSSRIDDHFQTDKRHTFEINFEKDKDLTIKKYTIDTFN